VFPETEISWLRVPTVKLAFATVIFRDTYSQIGECLPLESILFQPPAGIAGDRYGSCGLIAGGRLQS